jgi:signal transduction histidine kinase
MKIVPKLTLALMAGICLILGVNGYFRIRRERAFFEVERARDHEMIGRSLASATAAVWKSDGEQAAIQAIGAVDAHFTTIRVHWLSSLSPTGLAIDPGALDRTPAGQPVTHIVRDSQAGALWSTYVPLEVGGVRRGFIELSEPSTNEKRFLRSTIADTVMMALALVAVSTVLSFVMGQWLVGTPVRILSEKARRIGRGDFSGPVVLRHRDELSELAREMNSMCERLVTTVAQLRHADRLSTVGKLASGVAHELGTPLNVVGARARMIMEGEATADESKDYARIIVGATDRMTKTIRQVLQFARRGGVQRAGHDLRELVHGGIELLRPLADKRQVRLELTPSDDDVSMNIDAGQIEQVVTNLVMNSIQAMPRGGAVQLSVGRVLAEAPAEMGGKKTECLCLQVKDQGEGVAPEHLPHIFEPFFTTKDVGEGTGLGLAVSYGIIREHGGWIAVESEPHVGTTFSVFLPVTGTP